MITRQGNDITILANGLIKQLEEHRQLSIDDIQGVFRLRAVRTVLMSDRIVGRQRYRQNVGHSFLSQRFLSDDSASQFKGQFIEIRRIINSLA